MSPLLTKYPYYVVPAIEELATATGEERLALVRRIAAAVGDTAALRTILGIDPEEFAAFYPDMKAPELSTDDTIGTFLDRFGDPTLTKATEIEDIMAPAAVPYDLSALEALPEIGSADLLPEAPVTPAIPEVSIAPEVSEVSAAAEVPIAPEVSEVSEVSAVPKVPEAPAAEPILSESLAKIMIKNGNYQKALEIITEISLNNPKKSIYFADQIRFLKKLIAYTSISSKS